MTAVKFYQGKTILCSKKYEYLYNRPRTNGALMVTLTGKECQKLRKSSSTNLLCCLSNLTVSSREMDGPKRRKASKIRIKGWGTPLSRKASTSLSTLGDISENPEIIETCSKSSCTELSHLDSPDFKEEHNWGYFIDPTL